MASDILSFLWADVQVSEQLSWDTAKLIIQHQSNMALIAIAVLVGVAGLLMAGTWIWNFYLSRRKLDDAINDLKREIKTDSEKAFEDNKKILGELFEELAKTLDSKFEGAKAEIGEHVEKQITSVEAETARLHARDAQILKSWSTAALWWSRAIIGFSQSNEEGLLAVAVEQCDVSLSECEKLTKKVVEEIKDSLPFIPETLWAKKENIEDKLSELEKGMEKKPEKPKLVEVDDEED